MANRSRSNSSTLIDSLRKQSHNRNRTVRRASEHERRAETVTRRNDLLPSLTITIRPLDELVQ